MVLRSVIQGTTAWASLGNSSQIQILPWMFQPGSLHLVAVSYTTGDIKDFLLTAKGKDKRNKKNVKCKVRCSRSLYSLVITKSRQRSWSSPCPQIWQWRSWTESWTLTELYENFKNSQKKKKKNLTNPGVSRPGPTPDLLSPRPWGGPSNLF